MAARLIAAWRKTGAFSDRLLERVRDDRPFITELVCGVLRGYRRLDWIREQMTARRPRVDLDALVLVGLHQLLFMNQVQEYAAVHETVEAARLTLGPRAAGLVNALLRRAQADRHTLLATLARQPPGVRLSHPDLLIERWTARYGATAAERLCEWNNGVPRVTLRLNRTKIGREALLQSLRRAGVEGKPHPHDPDRFVEISHGFRPTDLPGFREGWFAVQDPSTALAVDLLRPQPGERILDACAAPGGKTLMIAEQMQGRGTLVAMDSSAARLKRLRENRDRLQANQVHIVEGRAGDAAPRRRVMQRFAPGGFDGILLDAPCTNSGVFRRRPDARWRFSRARLEAATRRQRALLEELIKALRPGGRLVYSTCSLEPEENEDQIRSLISRRPDMEWITEQRLFPPDSETDGAYAALLRRREEPPP